MNAILSKLAAITEISQQTNWMYVLLVNGQSISKYDNIRDAYADRRLYKELMPKTKVELVEL